MTKMTEVIDVENPLTLRLIKANSDRPVAISLTDLSILPLTPRDDVTLLISLNPILQFMSIQGFPAIMNTLKEFAGRALVTTACADDIKALDQSPNP